MILHIAAVGIISPVIEWATYRHIKYGDLANYPHLLEKVYAAESFDRVAAMPFVEPRFRKIHGAIWTIWFWILTLVALALALALRRAPVPKVMILIKSTFILSLVIWGIMFFKQQPIPPVPSQGSYLLCVSSKAQSTPCLEIGKHGLFYANRPPNGELSWGAYGPPSAWWWPAFWHNSSPVIYRWNMPYWWIAGASLSWFILLKCLARFPRGQCSKCGYDLRGTTTVICSECGTSRDLKTEHSPT